jgi:hypothetical protein
MSQPPTQPDREEQIRQLSAYLEQHRAQYDLTALRKQLLDAGYPNTLVDEALRRLDGGTTSPAGAGPRLLGCFFSLLNQALLGVAVYAAGSLTNDGTTMLFVALGVLGVELLAVRAMWSTRGREWASRILLWTVIWTVVTLLGLVALGALLFGICLALIGTQSF